MDRLEFIPVKCAFCAKDYVLGQGLAEVYFNGMSTGIVHTNNKIKIENGKHFIYLSCQAALIRQENMKNE